MRLRRDRGGAARHPHLREVRVREPRRLGEGPPRAPDDRGARSPTAGSGRGGPSSTRRAATPASPTPGFAPRSGSAARSSCRRNVSRGPQAHRAARSAPRSSSPIRSRARTARSARCASSSRPSPERWFYPDQYGNEENPRAHEHGTAVEIAEALDGRGRRVRRRDRHERDGDGDEPRPAAARARRPLPRGGAGRAAPRARGAEAHGELDRARHLPGGGARREDLHADRRTAGTMAERLGREEGLRVGHSAGAAVAGALDVARRMAEAGERGNVVTVLPDRADRYFEPPPLGAEDRRGERARVRARRSSPASSRSARREPGPRGVRVRRPPRRARSTSCRSRTSPTATTRVDPARFPRTSRDSYLMDAKRAAPRPPRARGVGRRDRRRVALARRGRRVLLREGPRRRASWTARRRCPGAEYLVLGVRGGRVDRGEAVPLGRAATSSRRRSEGATARVRLTGRSVRYHRMPSAMLDVHPAAARPRDRSPRPAADRRAVPSPTSTGSRRRRSTSSARSPGSARARRCSSPAARTRSACCASPRRRSARGASRSRSSTSTPATTTPR